ncbi:MAG: hypothetical protein QOH35_3638 [Acidobacteriaceae bacterium]|jgi:hypothetical protein|nr:hypothetical protein [Acidobacteriaceae bacterium]MEA2542272.1 hypothetical protein [Acidobacteriaceae bacterium]
MKRVSILPLTIVLTTTFAVGQATYQRPLRIDPANCPVGLQVRHGAGLPVGMKAGPAIDGRALSSKVEPSVQNQGINLTMSNLSLQDIVSVEITAHGFSNKGRYVPLSDTPQTPDLAKTVDVAVDVKGNSQASRDLSLSRFTAVTSVDVNSIKYANGSEWHAPSAGACSVTPDLIMLVASR